MRTPGPPSTPHTQSGRPSPPPVGRARARAEELTERIERAEAEEQAKADERLLAALAAGDADLEEKAGLGAAPGAAPGATEGAAPTEPQPMTWWGQ